ncbi:MAG: TIGR00725 family protein [Candidatus Goldiibacteriota bacterium]
MKIIGVIGGNMVNKKTYKTAEETGRLLAVNKAVVVCGGLGGVMEAVCKGAKKAGGSTIGILPEKTSKKANKYVDIAIPTGMGEARNVIIVNAAEGLIAIDGKEGTLSEIAFGLKHGKPVAGIDTYEIKGVVKASGPADAVKKIIKLTEKI